MDEFPSLSPIITHSCCFFSHPAEEGVLWKQSVLCCCLSKQGNQRARLRQCKQRALPFFFNISPEKVGRECSWIPNKLRGRKIFLGERAWLNSCRHACAPEMEKFSNHHLKTNLKRKKVSSGGPEVKTLLKWLKIEAEAKLSFNRCSFQQTPHLPLSYFYCFISHQFLIFCSILKPRKPFSSSIHNIYSVKVQSNHHPLHNVPALFSNYGHL